MISDVMMEKSLLDARVGAILEGLSSELPALELREAEDVGMVMECGDEICPAFSWVKNIG